jgi:hypothetical protein
MMGECRARPIWHAEQCSYPIEKDRFSVFHWPKPNREEKVNLATGELREAQQNEERFCNAFFDLVTRVEAIRRRFRR